MRKFLLQIPIGIQKSILINTLVSLVKDLSLKKKRKKRRKCLIEIPHLTEEPSVIISPSLKVNIRAPKCRGMEIILKIL